MTGPKGAQEPAVSLVGPQHAEGIVRLFERAGAPCFCQYFSYSGDNRKWQMRCALEVEANRSALIAAIMSGEMTAFVATQDGRVDGWLRIAHPEELGKRYEGRLYKGLPCLQGERTGLLSVSCFLVDPGARRCGLARQLLKQAILWANEQGASGLEAFPRGAQDVSDEEQWTGPLSLYEAEGFVRIHDFPPYPVLRLTF